MPDLHDLSAAELSEAFRDRRTGPVEVLRDVLAHIERCEPVLHATWALDPDGAMAQADAAQSRWLKGEPLSAIDGVPVTIKENIATRGTPVPLGTAASVLVPAERDAPPAQRLREAGAVMLGKTTMPDYGMLSSGLSSFHALARNPWDPSKNPGGSSAGAAAAAAAGYGPLHIGTDIGGSIRLPAGWCGLVGLKPSLGRIPIFPPYAGRVAGPMTRTVTDAALMMQVLAQPDARDTMSLPPADIDWLALDCNVAGLTLGLMMEPGCGAPVEPEVAAAVEAAAKRFEAAGATVVPMRPFMTRAMLDGMDRFWRCRAWAEIGALPAERRALVLPYIRDWARGGEHLSGAEVYHGFSQMHAMREAAVAACAPFDFVLTPTSPMPSFAAEWASPTNDPQRPFEHIVFTLPYNMSEQPAASINAGYTSSGLPIGLQIVGARFDDLGVLQLARAWERLRPSQKPWPALA